MKKTFYLLFLCINSLILASAAEDCKSAPGIEKIQIRATYSNPHHLCATKCALCKSKQLSVMISRNSSWLKLKEAFAQQLQTTAQAIQVSQSTQAITDEPIDLNTFDPKNELHVSLKRAL